MFKNSHTSRKEKETKFLMLWTGLVVISLYRLPSKPALKLNLVSLYKYREEIKKIIIAFYVSKHGEKKLTWNLISLQQYGVFYEWSRQWFSWQPLLPTFQGSLVVRRLPSLQSERIVPQWLPCVLRWWGQLAFFQGPSLLTKTHRDESENQSIGQYSPRIKRQSNRDLKIPPGNAWAFEFRSF